MRPTLRQKAVAAPVIWQFPQANISPCPTGGHIPAAPNKRVKNHTSDGCTPGGRLPADHRPSREKHPADAAWPSHDTGDRRTGRPRAPEQGPVSEAPKDAPASTRQAIRGGSKTQCGIRKLVRASRIASIPEDRTIQKESRFLCGMTCQHFPQ